jgi:hypothetical protein
MSIVLQGATSGSVTLQEPAIAGTTVLDLPAVSGTILTTGSSGQSIPKAALPTGSVLQVVNAFKSDTFSWTGTSLTNVTGLSVSITPLSATSKILVSSSLYISSTSGSYISTAFIRRTIGGTTTTLTTSSQANGGFLNSPSAASTGRDTEAGSISLLDSPATTSSISYFISVSTPTTDGNAAYINRWPLNGDFGACSSITVMEIAA